MRRKNRDLFITWPKLDLGDSSKITQNQHSKPTTNLLIFPWPPSFPFFTLYKYFFKIPSPFPVCVRACAVMWLRPSASGHGSNREDDSNSVTRLCRRFGEGGATINGDKLLVKQDSKSSCFPLNSQRSGRPGWLRTSADKRPFMTGQTCWMDAARVYF